MKNSPWLLRTLVVTVFLIAAISETCWAVEDVVIVDFKKNPLPAGWQVAGYAFGSSKTGRDRQQAARTTANQRQYQTGKLTSPDFTIERDYLWLEIGGVYHPEKCCVALVIGGRDVRRVSPQQAGNSSPSSMDIRDLRGKQARLEVRDEHFNGWVTLGRLIQTDKPKAGAQRVIPTWEPAVFEAKIDAAFLLLPLHDVAGPVQTVTIEIDGQEKLVADMPLAMHEPADYQPVFDLTGYQGKTLRVSYHRTAKSETGQLIRVSSEIPKHPIADSRPAFHVHCRFDPKIFWFSPTRGMDPKAEDGHWVMILFEDGGHSIFTSDNLKQWKKTGSIHGFHECPELFPLAVIS